MPCSPFALFYHLALSFVDLSLSSPFPIWYVKGGGFFISLVGSSGELYAFPPPVFGEWLSDSSIAQLLTSGEGRGGPG